MIDKVYKSELEAQKNDLIKILNAIGPLGNGAEGVLWTLASVHDTLAYYDEAPSDSEEVLRMHHEVLREYVLRKKEDVSNMIRKFLAIPFDNHLFDLNEAFMVLERVDEEELFSSQLMNAEKFISENPDKFKHLDKQAIKMKTCYRMFDDTILHALTTIA